MEFGAYARPDAALSDTAFCLGAFFENRPQIVHESKNLPPDTNAQINRTVFRINRMLRGHLEIPDKVQIRVSVIEKEPQAKHGILSVGRQITLSKGLNTDPRYFKTILAHEYGHSIFHANLKNDPAIGRLLDSHRIPRHVYQAAKAVLRPYDEFFADLVAIISESDGSAVRLTLTPEGVLKDGIKEAHARDFTFNHRLEYWTAEGPYSQLSPSRNYLWSIISKNQEIITKDPGQILSNTLDAIKEQLTKRIAEISRRGFPAPGPFKMGKVEEINRDFIESLQRAFAHF
jgi:hypothetical protein